MWILSCVYVHARRQQSKEEEKKSWIKEKKKKGEDGLMSFCLLFSIYGWVFVVLGGYGWNRYKNGFKRVLERL